MMKLLSLACAAVLAIASTSDLNAQDIINDTFNDGDFTTNAVGTGSFNSNIVGTGATATEAGGEASFVGGDNGGTVAAIRSVETFDANSAVTITGVFEVSDFGRSASVNGHTSRHYVGFSASATGQNQILEGGGRDGLWVGLQSRENTNGLDNGMGGLFYVDAGTVTTLASWTWDQSLVAWDSASTFRSDRIATDLLAPLTLSLTSDATGYSLSFATTGAGVLPADISGTWADAAVTNNLSVVYAAVNLQGDASGTLSLSSIQVSTPATGTVLLGDVNMDEAVDFLDISPFIALLSSGGFQLEADINEDTEVNFLDISPFIGILSGQ